MLYLSLLALAVASAPQNTLFWQKVVDQVMRRQSSNKKASQLCYWLAFINESETLTAPSACPATVRSNAASDRFGETQHRITLTIGIANMLSSCCSMLCRRAQ